MLPSKQLAQFSPGRIILFSVFFTILSGTLALALPISRVKPVNIIDLMFTATSTACITGFFTVPLDSFTRVGHIVLLILMQIGGIGLITLTILLLSLFVNFGFAHQVMAGQLLELESWKNIKKLILFITVFTLFAEIIGALTIYPILLTWYPQNEAIFLSIFHSISSFCNAGISLFPESLELFNTSYPLLLITATLMIIGGLGFITWREIFYYFKSLRRKKKYSFSLHSKIVLFGTFAAITLATILYLILEYDNSYAQMSYFQRLMNAFFQAASFRSGGFTTVPLSMLALPTLFITLFVMFVGASPGSTGSGVKITTITIFLASIKAAVTENPAVEIKGRQLPEDLVYKAIAIVVLSMSWICMTTLFLLITETGWGFLEVVLETISAFANIGISMGLTTDLTFIGKLFIMLSMIIGRVGSLTLILALRQMALKKAPEPKGFTYPEERVMLG